MLVTISELVRQERQVDITLPYYYRHDLMPDDGECIIYGRLDEQTDTSITIRDGRDGQSFEFRTEPADWRNDGSYINEQYKSTEAVYLAAKQEMLLAINPPSGEIE